MTNENGIGRKIADVLEAIKKKGSMAVAFSGGIDSSVVAALAVKALGNKALAVTVTSALQPSSERSMAKQVAKQLGVEHLEVRLNELRINSFKNNPVNRCYLCKKFRFERLLKIAEERGLAVVADGTNYSDLGEYRPGLKALKELGIYSPLIEAGLSKIDSWKIAKLINLPNVEKPSNSCLATRVPYGEALSASRLERIDKAEKRVRFITGARLVRVRDHGNIARVELLPEERFRLFVDKSMDRLSAELQELGYKFVTLDMEGYKPGKFDRKLELG
ncbi:ATP-dependent sacrificial sulfur transferase LarE [Chloroflexota bacterium]